MIFYNFEINKVIKVMYLPFSFDQSVKLNSINLNYINNDKNIDIML